MSPKFWENTTSHEQINEAEAKLQLSAAELLEEEKQNLWTGAGLSRNWKILKQISKWITRSFIWLLSEHFNGSFALDFNVSKSSFFSYTYTYSLPKSNSHKSVSRIADGKSEQTGITPVHSSYTSNTPNAGMPLENFSSRLNRKSGELKSAPWVIRNRFQSCLCKNISCVTMDKYI